MENKTVSVIASACRFDARKQSFISWNPIFETRCSNLDVATVLGECSIEPGYAVIVRPNYNEVDENGNRFFREWRSFNGKPLEEVIFPFNFGNRN